MSINQILFQFLNNYKVNKQTKKIQKKSEMTLGRNRYMNLQHHPINKNRKLGDVIQLNQAIGIVKMILPSNIANTMFVKDYPHVAWFYFNKPYPLFLQKELGYN